MPFSLAPNNLAGAVLRRREVSGFLLLERVYSAGLEIPKHCHEHAYISLMIEGSHSETFEDATVNCYTGAFRYMPPYAEHIDRFPEDTRCLLVRIEPFILSRFEKQSPLLRHPGEIQGMASAWLGKRLFAEFCEQDENSVIALEGILLEVLAEGARAIEGHVTGAMPRWLRRVREFLENSYRDNLSLQTIADVADVHPVHLAREFRRYFHCSIGEFLRKRRIEQACELLARSNAPIAEIALACGFSDQSHFSSAFKRQSGVTPGRYRQLS